MHPETCRQHASDCRHRAARTASAGRRALLLWHASVWEGLAGGDFRPARLPVPHPEAPHGSGGIAAEAPCEAEPAR